MSGKSIMYIKTAIFFISLIANIFLYIYPSQSNDNISGLNAEILIENIIFKSVPNYDFSFICSQKNSLGLGVPDTKLRISYNKIQAIVEGIAFDYDKNSNELTSNWKPANNNEKMFFNQF